MSILALPNLDKRLAEEAKRRDREQQRRREFIAGLAREVVQALSRMELGPGDTVEFTIRTSPPEASIVLIEELELYLHGHAHEICPSPAEQMRLAALRLVPSEAGAASAELETAWAETRRRMRESFAADPDLAAEFSTPLAKNEPEDELLQRSWAREFRSGR